MEKHGEPSAPFNHAQHMYDTIEEIDYGQNTWYSFEVFYKGEDRHEPGAALWKNATYKVYARDTHEVLVSQLASTDFDGHYDYTAHKDTEQQPDGSWTPKYSNLMSGDWAWNKSVCIHYVLSIPHQQLTIRCRMSLLRTHK
jgi:hypothetical protein